MTKAAEAGLVATLMVHGIPVATKGKRTVNRRRSVWLARAGDVLVQWPARQRDQTAMPAAVWLKIDFR